MSNLPELLSRLCFRLSDDKFAQAFDMAITMYKLPLFRESLILHKGIGSLLKRLILACPQTEILRRMDALLSLPIPTESGFEVSIPDWWIEPFDNIIWVEGTAPESDYYRATWSAPIANLIRIAKDGTPEARKRAISRLAKLHQIDGLNAKESADFGQALWAKVDPNKGLPSDTSLRDSAFLHFPEIEEGKAKDCFRNYLLTTEFPRVVERSTTSDGQQSKSMSIGPSLNERYIDEWINGTVPLFPRGTADDQDFVDWSVDEVIQLLRKAEDWWKDEKGEIQDNHNIYSFAGEVRQSFSNLVDLMSRVILPRLSKADTEDQDLTGYLLSELEGSGVCVISALPMTLFIYPGQRDEVARRLRSGLNSMEPEEIRESIRGLFLWIVYGQRQEIAEPPADLVSELINRTVSRRQPGLGSALDNLAIIVKGVPEILDEDRLDSLCVALEYLLEETKLTSNQEQESQHTSPIQVDDRPAYRSAAAGLAYRLFAHYRQLKKEAPQILLEWKQVCQADPLPEVRRRWEEV